MKLPLWPGRYVEVYAEPLFCSWGFNLWCGFSVFWADRVGDRRRPRVQIALLLFTINLEFEPT